MSGAPLLQGDAFAKYGLWIRDVFFEPEQDVPWVIWQFANRDGSR